MDKEPSGKHNQEKDNEIFIQDEMAGLDGYEQNNQNAVDPGNDDIRLFGADNVEIENPVSQVASPPARNILIFGILIVISIGFLYKFVFKESDKSVAEKKRSEEIAAQPVTSAKPATPQGEVPQVNVGVVDAPDIALVGEDSLKSLPPLPATPELPVAPANKKLEMPIAPAPVVAPAPAPRPVVLQESVKLEDSARNVIADQPKNPEEANPFGPDQEQIAAQMRSKELAKRKIGMLVMNGGGTPKNGSMVQSNNNPSGITKIEDLNLVILQGKMIEAILETTVNTDLPGNLRAVINRDIYAEAGKNILIPSGSRLLGNYGSGISVGQQRLLVTWGRIIRPDGVSINIASQGTDQLGRSGMAGLVDNKYVELFANAMLTSAVTIGGAMALGGAQTAVTSSSSTNAATGTTNTSTATPADSAILQAIQNITNVGNTIARGESTAPTLIINQGSRIMVYVNQDIIFPASFVNSISNMN